jgi:cytochrome P450
MTTRAFLTPPPTCPCHNIPRAVEWDDLGRMKVLNAVIKETLRVHSPASLGSIRVSSKTTKVRAAC